VIHKIKSATKHLFLGLLIAFAIGISLVRLFLLGVEDYKMELESKIYQLTEIPIKIGTMRANMRGFSPEIVLKDIDVLTIDTSNNYPIKLEELRLGINLLDLLFTQQVLPSSWITLVGVKLSVVRKEDGSLSIDGLDTAGSGQPFWLLKTGRYEVLKSEITWLDKQRQALPITFEHIDLLIKNKHDSESHEVHLISQLPDKFGKSLRVSMSFQGNVFKKDNINGLVYIKGHEIQLAEVLTGKHPTGLKLLAGKGGFELWSQWKKSKNIALTGNVQAKNISIKKQKQVFTLDQLQADFTGIDRPSGWQFGVADFIAKIADKTWPPSSFNFSANKEMTQLATSIDQLDLQAFSKLIQFFAPLDRQQKKLVSKLDLKGQLKNVTGYIDTEKNSVAISGVFENIFASATADSPQLENFTGSIHGSDQAGVFGLNTQQGSLFSPDLFRAPFSIKELTALISWQQQADSWQVKADNLLLKVKDAESISSFRTTMPKNGEAIFMDLQTSFSKLNDVSAIPEYYPVSIIKKDVLRWLDKAFVAGKIEQGGLLVYGELDQFPFLNGQGAFEVFLDAKQVELEVAPDWPHLTNVNAEILFNKDSLVVTADRAEVNGMKITHTSVKIPSFRKSKYLLAEGRAKGDIANGLAFLQKTPLHGTVDQFLDQVTPSGALNIVMDFKVPLLKGMPPKVNGIAHLKSVALNIKAIDFNLTKVKGDLKFTEKGLFSKTIMAKALGYPLAIEVDTKDFNTAVSVIGITDIKQLQKQFSFLNNELLEDDWFKGEINYQLMLDLPATENSTATLSIDTDLAGVSIDLPGLLKKSATQNKPLNLNLSLNNEELLPLALSYGDSVKVMMNIDKRQGEIMYSAHIAVGQGLVAVLPKKKGIKLQVEQDVFDITEWMAMMDGTGNGESGFTPMLDEISFITKDLQWKNSQYGAFEIAMKRFGQQWQGSLTCLAAKGAFSIPVNLSDKEKIKLEMAYIELSKLMQIDFQGNGFETEELPLIDVFSEQFWWKSVNLGSLKIETERTSEGIRFNRIDVLAKNHKIQMTADWVKQGKDSVTNFQGTLLADDIGILLSKFGVTDDLKEASASIKYSGYWPKSPYQFSLANMDADINMQLMDGRISSIEPGLGRLLGLVAMEQWIKRLTLNFGDLFKKGLSFNNIKGNFNVSQGKAHTTDLKVDAIPAQISITGGTDLMTEVLDYRVSVVPKSAGAVPIAGTIVSSIAGTITRAVTDDYKKGYFFGSEYQVTGRWGDIKVKSMHDQDGIFNKTWTGLTDFFLFKPEPVTE
jgi:uncharacterized protein (TIGR02099 family)